MGRRRVGGYTSAALARNRLPESLILSNGYDINGVLRAVSLVWGFRGNPHLYSPAKDDPRP